MQKKNPCEDVFDDKAYLRPVSVRLNEETHSLRMMMTWMELDHLNMPGHINRYDLTETRRKQGWQEKDKRMKKGEAKGEISEE